MKLIETTRGMFQHFALMNLKTGARMALAYGLVVVLVGATTSVGVVQVRAMKARLDTIVKVNSNRADLSSTMIRAIYGTAVAIRNAALAKSTEAARAQAATIQTKLDTYLDAKARLLASFDAYPVSEAEKTQFVVAEGAGNGARNLMKQLLDPAGDFTPEDIAGLVALSLERSQGTWIEQLEKLIQVQREQAALSVQQAESTAHRAEVALMAFGSLAAVLCLASGWLLTRSVTSGIRLAVERSRRVADGKLTAAHLVHRGDEFGDLLGALDRMRVSISGIVSQVIVSARNIEKASVEIAGGSKHLSEWTDRAAGQLQQTASSMEQLTGTVKQTADSAHTANQLVSSASAVASRGGEVVSLVVSTMQDINTSSKKIADIIGVIDGIAFQTNILALNAAVEAARAGEQGRGFAVVAGEVRSLAQRSAEAAKEIKALIGASVDKVESGSKLVQDAGITMTEIVASVQRVSDIIGEIAAAASEQSSGIGQVNTSVTQLDRVTQQNATLAEQSAFAARSLLDQACCLTKAVSAFEVERSPV